VSTRPPWLRETCVALAVAMGCVERPEGAPARSPEALGAVSARSPREAPADGEARVVVHSSARCGECHSALLADWQASGHAQSARTPRFVKERARAADPASCDRCHAPLAAVSHLSAAVRDEGVNCEVCHSLAGVDPAQAPPTMTYDFGAREKRGSRCDGSPPYFHGVRCSPLHASSAMCEGCHSLTAGTPERPIPVLTEHADWRAAGADVECQYCHFRGRSARLVVGEAPRRSVATHHSAVELDGARDHGVDLSLRAVRSPDSIEVIVSAANVGAMHALPAGLPGRRLVVELRTDDPAGAPLARHEAVFARRLGSEAGEERPFYEATHLLEDTRLAAGESRVVRARLRVSPGASLRLTLRAEDQGVDVAARLGARPTVEVLEAHTWVIPRGMGSWRPSNELMTKPRGTLAARSRSDP
jgi:hypothetical protein